MLALVFAGDAHKPSLKHLRSDFASGVVVALVALPLCLGIALASGAPLAAGLVTGIVGGILVSWISGSRMAVSGPAAGLTVIVLGGIESLGTFQAFLLAVVLAGFMQVGLGLAKAGELARFVPNSVVKGMLAAIGIILILKQIPHAVGYDVDYEGDFSFIQADGHNTLTEIPTALARIHLGAALITVLGLAILILWPRIGGLKKVPAPLVVVLLGTLLNEALVYLVPGLGLETGGLVAIPVQGPSDLAGALVFPDFSGFMHREVWVIGLEIAVVASLETLLCLEAMDGLDPEKQHSNPNRELIAQGIGNSVAGLLGGIPMTAVIVRGSANIQSGAKTRVASFIHGAILLGAIAFVPFILNQIPLAALAAILLHIGYKLAPISLVRDMLKRSWSELLPFVATVAAILLTDLLIGVAIGLGVALFFVLRSLSKSSDTHHHGDDTRRVRILLGEHVSFLTAASLRKSFDSVPDGAVVTIDGKNVQYIDADALELIHEFKRRGEERGIKTELVGVPDKAA